MLIRDDGRHLLVTRLTCMYYKHGLLIKTNRGNGFTFYLLTRCVEIVKFSTCPGTSKWS